MTLKSYTILKFDEDKGVMTVVFKFDDEGKEVVLEEGLSYNHNVGFDELVLINKDETYLDDEGKKRIRTIQVLEKVLKTRKAFQVSDTVLLDKQIKEYAVAYMRGKEMEKESKIAVTPDVLKQVGVENTTGI